MSCATRHPHLPPVALSPATCLHCTLHTLQSPHSLPTLRRSAAASLSLLSSSSANNHLTESTMTHVLTTLQHTMFHTPQLQHDILPLCVQLASLWDLPMHGARASLISSCVDALSFPNPPLPALRLLSSLLDPTTSPIKHISSLFRPSVIDSLCLAVFRIASSDYSAASIVLNLILPNLSQQVRKALPPLLDSILPATPCDQSRLLFLEIAHHLNETHIQLQPHTQRTLNELLCTSFISTDLPIRKAASQLLQTSYVKTPPPNLFEYIIEGLRDTHLPPHRSKRSALLKHNLLALSLVAPSAEPPHWCYAFRTVLAAMEHSEDAVPYSCQIIHTAVERTPPSVFAAGITPALVAFVMRLFSTDHLPVAVRSISTIFKRYKASLKDVQVILGLIECVVEKNVSLVYELTRDSITQFRRLAGEEVDREDLQVLGRRILLIVFDKCASQLEGKQQPVEHFKDLVQMFAEGLDPLFSNTLACSDDDRMGIQRWCWHFFPPRVVISFAPEVFEAYIWRISTGSKEKELSAESSMPWSESSLLSELSGDISNSLHSTALIVLQKAVELKKVDSLGLPETILEALVRRLQSLDKDSSEALDKYSKQIVQVVRLISLICSQQGLCFPIPEIQNDILERTLCNDDFSFILESDKFIITNIFTFSNRGQLDVTAWDTLASRQRTLEKPNVSAEIFIREVLQAEENSTACESLLFAISKSSQPETISEFVLDAFESVQGYDTLYEALECRGLIPQLCCALETLPRHGHFSISNSKSLEYDLQIARTLSLISFLSCARSIADSVGSWNLLRILSDVFTRESISQDNLKVNLKLLCAVTRCLIAILRCTEDHQRISFVIHSGVESQAIKLLNELPVSNRLTGILISAVVCLLNLFIKKAPRTSHAVPELPITIEFLTSRETWEKLLVPAPGLSDCDETNRMTNSCFLLESLLVGGKGDVAAFEKIISTRIALLLYLAALSWSELLCDAAQKVLCTILKHEFYDSSLLSRLGTCREMSHHVVSNLCSSGEAKTKTSEILLLAEMVRRALADQHIPKLKKYFEDLGRDWPSENSKLENSFKEAMPTELIDLFHAVEDRICSLSPAEPQASAVHMSEAFRAELKKEIKSEFPSEAEGSTDVILGRYTMIWTRSADIISPMLETSTQL